MAVQTQILHRRGTAATWTSTNPTLGAGEIGYETDTGKYKIGTGSAVWTSLAYASILPSTVTAKGDILAASAASTPAALAVGNNGETIVADSSTSTGLRYQSAYNGNAIINGGFDIWQRGTSFGTGGQYTADRWYKDGQTYSTISQQTTSDTTNLPNIFYCARVARNSGQTGTTAIGLTYTLESLDSYRFAGQNVTVSFYARAGANFSATSNALTARVYSGTGTNQRRDFSTGFTGEATPISQTATLTTTWQRFTYTGAIASTATELAVQIYFGPTGTAGANDYFEVTGVQLELGSIATTFKRSNGSGGTIQGELAACQRYYYRSTPGTAYAFQGTMAYGQTTTIADAQVALPVTMRTNATSIDISNVAINDGTNYYSSGTFALQASSTTTNITNIRYTHGSAVFTAAKVYQFNNNNNTSGYVGISAEL